MTHRSPRRLAVLACLSVAPCTPQEPAPRCPSDALVEALHASTFQFEHGASAEGHAWLLRAQTLAAQARPDATAAATLRALARIDATRPSPPPESAEALERMRASFSDWRCLTPALHARLHRALEPLR